MLAFHKLRRKALQLQIVKRRDDAVLYFNYIHWLGLLGLPDIFRLSADGLFMYQYTVATATTVGYDCNCCSCFLLEIVL